jgi:hypothetical protein
MHSIGLPVAGQPAPPGAVRWAGYLAVWRRCSRARFVWRPKDEGNGLALGRRTGGAAAGCGRGPTGSGADVDTDEDSEVDEVAEVEVELGQSKVSICHKGRVITIGAPALGAHLRKHDDGECTNACQVYGKGGTCDVSNGVVECACSDEILTTDVVEGEQTDAVEGEQRGKPRKRKDAKRAKQRARLEARRAAKHAR